MILFNGVRLLLIRYDLVICSAPFSSWNISALIIPPETSHEVRECERTSLSYFLQTDLILTLDKTSQLIRGSLFSPTESQSDPKIMEISSDRTISRGKSSRDHETMLAKPLVNLRSPDRSYCLLLAKVNGLNYLVQNLLIIQEKHISVLIIQWYIFSVNTPWDEQKVWSNFVFSLV